MLHVGNRVSRVLVVGLALAAACGQLCAAADYKDYASLLAPVMLLQHGSWERADQAIADWAKQTAAAIAGIAQTITGQQKPGFVVNPPLWFVNGATNVSTTVAATRGLAIGINYNPCVISTSAHGADATAVGVNIEPDGLQLQMDGASVWPWGVNIQPALLYVNPWGAISAPEGATITPTLIAVAPTAVTDGHTDVEIQRVGRVVGQPGIRVGRGL